MVLIHVSDLDYDKNDNKITKITKQFQHCHTLYLPSLPLSFPLPISLEQLH